MTIPSIVIASTVTATLLDTDFKPLTNTMFPISLMKISERMIELIREYFQRVVKAYWITVTSTINTSPYF